MWMVRVRPAGSFAPLFAQRPEARANFCGEEVRLFPGREVAAFAELEAGPLGAAVKEIAVHAVDISHRAGIGRCIVPVRFLRGTR
jgi:hypothetical protein